LSSGRLKIVIELEGLRAEAEGGVEEVLRFVLSFLQQHVPTYGLAHKLASGPDLTQLVDSLQEYIGYSEGEGLFIKPSALQLSVAQQILLFLAKTRLENFMGLSQKSSVSVPELAEALKVGAKTLTARLAELAQSGFVKRVERGEYQVTSSGLNELLARVKTPSQGV